MLFREIGEEIVAIPQPSHSWLSGQLARSWGNAEFTRPAPFEEFCLGAEQHDIGWLGWEAAPTFNPKTGRPHEFREVDARTHTELWTRGVERAGAFGGYPALLVSLHANTIYRTYFNFAKAPAQEAQMARDLLAEQHEFQQRTIAALAADPRYEAAIRPETLETNRLLIAAMDWMSLVICWGSAEEANIPNVPRRGSDRVTLRLAAWRGDPAELVVDPWPFREDRLEVLCEGHRLSPRYAEEAAMRQALEAPQSRATIAARLRPA